MEFFLGVKESQRFKIIKKILHRDHIGTAGFYYPGHGKRKSEEFSTRECIRTLDATVKYISKTYPKFEISLLGVSFGASVILLLNSRILQKVKSITLISTVLNLSIFTKFKFDKTHYDRWGKYGFDKSDANYIFQSLSRENLSHNQDRRMKKTFEQLNLPKLIIHGLNDRVTAFSEITELVDQNTTLLVYSGGEGTHDLKGKSLVCASKHIQAWVSG